MVACLATHSKSTQQPLEAALPRPALLLLSSRAISEEVQ